MGLDCARTACDPCRRAYALVGLEQLRGARLCVRNQVLRETIEASDDLPYELCGLLRGDVGIGRCCEQRLRTCIIQPDGLFWGAPEREQPAFLGNLGPDLVPSALFDLEPVPNHQKRCADGEGAAAYGSAAPGRSIN